MPQILCLIPLLSLDTLLTGAAYACRGIRIPLPCRLLIGAVGGLCLCLSVGLFGHIRFLPTGVVRLLSCLLLWGIGSKPLWQPRLQGKRLPRLLSVLADETAADRDASRSLSLGEAAVLSAVLSADSLLSGVGLSSPLPLPLLFLLGCGCMLFFLSAGLWAGGRLQRKTGALNGFSAICFFLLGIGRLR